MRNVPAFSYRVTHARNGANVVLIVDEYNDAQPTPSVTNAVEYVCDKIVQDLGFVPAYWAYLDTMDAWDQIVVDAEGKFKSFAPIPRTLLRGDEVAEYLAGGK